MSVLNNFLLAIINFFYQLIPNYGVAIILFTILIKALLSPLDLKSRRSMRKMSAVNPKIEALKKKYANDQEKLNQKTAELYKEEKISPMSGCLPMLLTMPILFAMFAAMRMVANDKLVEQFLLLINGQDPAVEPFLWIRNLWMPDSFMKSIMPDQAALRAITQDVWERISATLVADGKLSADTLLTFANKEAFDAYIAGIPDLIAASPMYESYLTTIPMFTNVQILFFNFSIYTNVNGYFILPILAVVTQMIMTRLTQNPATTPQAGGADNPAASTNKMMMMVMPIMSLVFCATSSAAFAVYWVMSNVIAGVQQVVFNRYFEWQDRKAAVAQEVGIK